MLWRKGIISIDGCSGYMLAFAGLNSIDYKKKGTQRAPFFYGQSYLLPDACAGSVSKIKAYRNLKFTFYILSTLFSRLPLS
jgi:hypothetical protein